MIELRQIEFTEGKTEMIPDKITVEMSADVALWMAKVAGRCSQQGPWNEIYDCLVGDVFNRYWDGVDDALEELGDYPIPIKKTT